MLADEIHHDLEILFEQLRQAMADEDEDRIDALNLEIALRCEDSALVNID